MTGRLAVLCLALVFAQEGSGAAQREDATTLSEGMRIQRHFVGGNTGRFTINLNAGDFLHVTVEQQGVDVIAELANGDGVILTQDSPNGQFGIECIAYVARDSGQHRLTLTSFGGGAGAQSGNIELHVIAHRIATSADAIHGGIERALAAAQQLRLKNTAGSRAEAIDLFNVALRDSEPLGLLHEQSLAAYGIGLSHLRGGASREAVPYIERAFALFAQLGVPIYASAATALGGAFDGLGDIRKAREYYRHALEQYQKSGVVAGQGVAHNNIGKLYADTSDWQLALAEYRVALSLFRDARDTPREALALHNIGVSYVSLGDFARAIEYLRQSLDIRTTLKDVAGQAEALTNLGRAEMGRGDHDTALSYLRRALLAREVVGDKRSEGLTRVVLSDAYFSVGQASQAREAAETAVGLLQAANDRRGHAVAMLSFARASVKTGSHNEASLAARRALAVFVDSGDTNNVARALTAIADAERMMGRLELSLEYLERAMTAVESVRSQVGSDLSASYLARRYETPKAHIDLLMKLAARDASVSYMARALAASERARARSLADMLTEAGLRGARGVDATALGRERQLAELIRAKSERALPVLARNRDDLQAKALMNEITALEAEHQEVRGTILRTSPAYAALAYPQSLDVIAIQQDLLDNHTHLVEFSLADEASYVWVVSNASIKGIRLEPRWHIEAAAREVYSLVTARGTLRHGESASDRQRRVTAAEAALNAALGRLSDLIITPLGDLSSAASRLLIVADGPLQYIPFGMLPRRASDGTFRPLIVDYEIVTMPSASVLAVQREQMKMRAIPTAGVAVIADPVFDRTDRRLARSLTPALMPPNERDDTTRILEHISQPSPAQSTTVKSPQSVIPRLQFTRNEADAILSVAKGTKNFRAVDFAATKKAVLGGALKDYRIIHFATHGFLDTERPTLSSIVLSLVDRNGRPLDGFLRAQELYNLDLNADLVVLSACQTGLGKSIEGEGLIGLTRGLMYAGAQRVVVSLWNVSDRATASLMSRFYRDMLVSGKTPAAALRAAQLEIMKIKGWESPYYWAPFIMQGDWR